MDNLAQMDVCEEVVNFIRSEASLGSRRRIQTSLEVSDTLEK